MNGNPKGNTLHIFVAETFEVVSVATAETPIIMEMPPLEREPAVASPYFSVQSFARPPTSLHANVIPHSTTV